MIWVGIDPGVNTGVAVWKDKKFYSVTSMPIYEAQKVLFVLHRKYGEGIKVRIEDARKRTWFGKAGREKLQGVGSVKRDCGIWEEFCVSERINAEFVHPKNNKTKLKSEAFKIMTGYQGRTNEHGRDAAMLVFGK